MLLTSWVRSFRQSLQNRRRGNRRGLDWQTQSLHGDAGRRSRNTELLEDRMLLTAFVIDQQFVDANSGTINISNSTIDIDSDGTPEFDSIVFDDATISGVGGVGINVNLSDLVLNRIVFQGVQLGDQAAGDNQTSGINITLDNIDLEAIAFDDTTVFSGFGGGVDIDLVDVQIEELAIFNSTITSGFDAGVSIDVASVSRNGVVDQLAISGSTIDGVEVTGAGIRKGVTAGVQANPVTLTVPEHGLQTGTDVVVEGVTGLVEANTRATITNIDESTISLTGVDASGAAPYISGGTVTVLTNFGDIDISDNTIIGDDGLSVALTDVEVGAFSVSENRQIDSADLTLTRTPIDGLAVRGNQINGDRPQVDALQFDLTQSTLTNLVVDDNTIANTNGGLAGGDGVVFIATDSNVYGSISGNEISGMLGNAIQFGGTASAEFVGSNRGPQVFDFNSLASETILDSPLSATATSVQVVDGRQFQSQQLILIDAEFIAIQAVNGNTLTVQRAQQGTQARAHALNARVRSITSSASGTRRSIADNTISNSTGAGVFAVLPENVSLDASVTGNTFGGNRARAIDITARNTIAAETTLQRGGISRTSTTLPVVDASVFGSFLLPFDIQVEGETMTVTGITGNDLTVVRGVNGTSARAHLTNTRAVANQGDAVNLEVGTTVAADRNTFSSNRNGAVVVELQDKTGGSVSVVNNIITGTEGTSPDALRIELTSVDTQVEATSILRRSLVSGNLIGVDAVATLQVALPAGLTVFTVTDASGFSVGQRLRIEDEQVDVTDVSGNTLTVTRGANGSTDAAHNAFAAVIPTTGRNIGRGISVTLDERSTIEDFLITGNVIANQGDDGIRFRREGDGVTRSFNPFSDQARSVSIVENAIIANASAPTADAQGVIGGPTVLSGGIEIQSLNGAEDSFDIEIIRNDILSHRAGGSVNGINLRAEADALILADITDNSIRFNVDDGVNTSDRQQSSDARDVSVTVLKNTISDNDGAGIRFNTSAGVQQVAVVGLEGADPVDGQLYQNIISNNGREGIHIDGGSFRSNISIAGNEINDNGRITFTASSSLQSPAIGNGGGGTAGDILGSGILVDASFTEVAITGNEITSNNGAGVDVNRSGDFSIRNNSITFNQNDGIESFGSVEAVILGNFIGSNGGRGIDVLVSGFASLNIPTGDSANYMIGDGQESGRNRIVGNEEEGIYYVLSAVEQDQNVLSHNNPNTGDTNNSNPSFTLAANNSRANFPDAIFQVDTNTIDGNGVGTNSPTTGLFMRIGSTEGLSNTPYENEIGTPTGVGSQNNLNPNSRTNARIVNNSFGGNFGEDARFETFVSTQNPDTTTGNWGVDPVPQYSGPGYGNDPLARLNLVFEGNAGDGLNAATAVGSYSNAEPVWKSRDGANNGPDNGGPTGPFPNGGTRGRSITLTPSRNTLTPSVGSPLNQAPDAVYTISDVTAVDIGNGVTELLVTLATDIYSQYNGVLPPEIQSGDSVEITDVFSVDFSQHSANGIFFVDVISRGTPGVGGAQIQLRATADDNGAAYRFGGQAIFNLNTQGNVPGPTSLFMYPGMGRSTLRVAQGADSAGSAAQDEFSSGADFSPFVWETFIALPYQEGTITNVTDAGGGRLTITAPNHGLSNGRQIQIAGVEGVPGSNRSVRQSLSSFSNNLRVVNQDQFTISGTFNGTYVDGGVWYTLDESFPAPDAPTFPLSDVVDVSPDPRANTSGVVTITFTEDVTGLDIDDIILLRDGVPVDISGVLVQQVSARSFNLDLTSASAGEGEYELIIDGSLPLASFVPVSPDPRSEPAGVVTVNFTEDVTGVDIFDFALYRNQNDGEGFQPVDLSEIGANLAVTSISESQYTIDLTSVTGDEASYELTLMGPRDVAVNSLLINGSGEVVVNASEHGLVTGQTLSIEGLRGTGTSALGITTALNGTFRVIADDADSFRLADATLATVFMADDSSYSIASSVFQFDSTILDKAGRQYKANAANVSSDAREEWVYASTPPVGDIIDVSPDPRSTRVDTVAVSFSEPVVINTVGVSDFRLTRDIGNGPFNVSLAGASLVALDDPMGTGFASQFELRDLALNQAGDYRLTLVTFDSTRIQDRTGSFLAAPAIDEFAILDTGAFPDIIDVFPEMSTAAVGTVRVVFSEGVSGVDTANAATNFTLTRDTGDGSGPQAVTLVDPMTNMPLTVTEIDSQNYEIDLTPVTGDASGDSIDGVYLLTLLPGNGITSDGDSEALAIKAEDTWTQDSTSPTANIVEVAPDPRIQHAGVVTINFSEPVTNVNVFNAATDFQLTRDIRDGNGPQLVNLAGVRVRAISPVDLGGNSVLPFAGGQLVASTYVLDLSGTGLTDFEGIYELSLTTNGNIVDLTGNAFVPDADAIDAWTLVPRLNDDIIRDNTFTSDVSILRVFGIDEVVSNNRVLLDSSDVWFTDLTAPEVVPGTVSISPDPRSTAVGILTIDFTEPVAGFNLTDLVLTRDGSPVSLNGLTLNQVTQSRYTIDLNLTTGAPGDYVLSIQGAGSLIEDLAGNPISASLIGLDSWTVENIGPSGSVLVTPDPRTTSANNVQVSFTKEIDVAQLDTGDFRLERDTGSGFTEIVLTGATVVANTPVLGFDDSFTLDLSAAGLTDVEGTYRLTLVASDSGIVDRAGIELASDASDIWVLDGTSPTVDIVDITPDPRQTEVGTVNVIFNEGVTGVDIADFVLLKDSVPVDISGLTVIQQTALRYTLDLSSVTTDDATYELRLVTTDGATPIQDIAGNALPADTGLVPADTAALDGWFKGVDVDNPTVDIVDVLTPRANAAGIVMLRFSEDVSGVDINDIELSLDTGGGPGLVDISALVVTPSPGSATEYQLDLSTVTVTQGTYTLRVVTTDSGSPIVDAAGNGLAGTSGVADEISFVVQTIDPSATIETVTPDPRLRAVGVLSVTFSQDVQGVDLTDFTLTRDTGTGAQPVSLRNATLEQSPAGADVYFLDLSRTTGADGVYTLTLTAETSGITAVATGDPMTSDAIESWATITTITVNTTNDTVDVSPGDGVVADSSGNVSLRAAIMETNALAGDDVIVLPAGDYTLSIGGVGEDFSASGDLDIREVGSRLTIRGAGADVTTIDAASLERVFHVFAGATFDIEGVTITGGLVTGSEDGGGVRNDGGTVSITDSVVTGNVSQDDAGGINNTGNLTLTRVTVSDNSAARTGGGVRNSGQLTIVESTIGGEHDPTDPMAPDLRNTAVLGGGGIINLTGGTLTASNSTISGNVSTTSQGAGIFTIGRGTLTNVTVSNNEAAAEGGGIAVAGGLIELRNTVVAGNASTTATVDIFDATAGGSLGSTGNNLIGDNTGATAAFPDPAPNPNPNVNGDFVGTAATPIDPLLGALADNGGPMLTHNPLFGSPVIDAGGLTSSVRDQRGITRDLNGVDIGAVEFGGFFVNSTADSIDINPGDGIVADSFGRRTLRAAIMEANALPGTNTIQLGDGSHELSLTEIDTTPPTADIVDVTPDPLSAQSTLLDPVDEIVVNFSEPVQGIDLLDASTNFTLTFDDGTGPVGVSLAGITVRQDSDTQYVLEGLTTLLSQDGLYDLRLITTGITDFALAPNTLADDLLAPAANVGAFDSFVRGADVFAPTAMLSQVTTPRTTNPGAVNLTFSESVFGVDLSSNPANFALTYDDDGSAGPNAPQVVALNAVAVQQITASEYVLDLTTVLDFTGLTDPGEYSLTFDGTATTIFDFSANQFTGTPLSTTWVIQPDTTPPSADIVDISPDPRIGAVGVTTIDFTEDVTGVDLTNADTDFDLFRDIDGFGTGAAATQIDISGLTVTQVTDSQYTVDLSTVTAGDGEYRFVVRTDGLVLDLAGSLLDATLGAGDVAEDFWATGDTFASVSLDDAASFGDLDITAGDLVIIGNSESTSIIDANQIDRVFDVFSGTSLSLQNVTVTGGQTVGGNDGGGVRSLGTLAVADSTLTGNSTDANGGAIYTAGTGVTSTLSGNITATDAALTVSNVAVFPAQAGFVILVGNEQMRVESINGAVFSVTRAVNGSTATVHAAGAVASVVDMSLSNTTIVTNNADFGAGVFNDGGTVTVAGSSITSNIAATDGGGVYNDRTATLNVVGSTLVSNRAGRDGGGVYNNDSATASITDATLNGNNAVRNGGGLFNEIVAIANLNNTRFSANTAGDGGGVYNEDGQVVIAGGSLIANVSTGDGGGLLATSSAVTTVDGTSVSGNRSGGDGGAFSNDGSLTISNSTVASNTADGDGAAIANSSVVSINTVTLSANAAVGSGGAIYNQSVGNVNLAGATISNNTAGADGGGIANVGAGRLTFGSSTLDGNTAGNRGGGLFHSSAVTATITEGTISNNSAVNGGGIGALGAIQATNSTVSGNQASANGGGINNGADSTYLNVTIVNNTAAANGGGVFNASIFGPARLKNTIVARNTGATGADVDGSGFVSQGNNLIGDGGAVTAFTNGVGGNIVGATGTEIDPLISPLQDNGGATLTHALLFGSPARDAGNNVGVTANDQRGFDRRFDGDGDGTSTVDIGSFESGLTVNSFLDTVDVNPGDRSSADLAGNSTLRAAIMEANAQPGADSIVLLPGTYRLTIAGRDENDTRTGDLDVTETLTIIGAGDGSTIIDAAGLDRAFHVIAGASLNLMGVTVINGDADLGGAILNQGVLNFENSTVTSSSARLGGGIYNDITEGELDGSILAGDTTITVSDVTDFPRQAGFTITIDSEDLRVDSIAGSTFTVARGVNGTVANAHLDDATVTYVGTATVNLTNANVVNNEALLNGGGIYNNDQLFVSSSTVSSNVAGVRGGGIYNTETATITQSTLDSNVAEVNGGAIYNEGTVTGTFSSVTVTGSTLSNNEAGVLGGAIFNSDRLSIDNSTLSGNSTGSEGGAIYNTGVSQQVTSTVAQASVTVVLDFIEAGQAPFVDALGNPQGAFDVTTFGFQANEFDTVTQAILDTVNQHYLAIPTSDIDGRSPIPQDMQLDIEFVIGDVGTAPSNGATEFYYVTIGSDLSGTAPLGVAFLNSIRNAAGNPSGGFNSGDPVGTIYSDNIQGLGGLTPSNALTSGDLFFTANAIAGTTSHEIGHALSLLHLNNQGAVTPTGVSPVMGTGAIDLPNQQRILTREFAYTGQNNQAGGATQMHVQQLVGALGLRAAPVTSQSPGVGFLNISNSTIVNNTSDLEGGGIVNASGSTAQLRNSIVASNVANNANATALNADNDVRGAFTSLNTNFIGDSGTSSGFINGFRGDQVGSELSPLDPVFGALATNGGATQTHELLPGSPAIDAGDNSGGEPTDQRNGQRPTDNTADIGAFEVQQNSIRITDVTAVEGNSGSTEFIFSVVLDTATAEPITVNYGTIQGTATQGSDFLGTAGTLVFAPGELSKTITVEVNGDTTTEANEEFIVQLFSPINAVITDAQGVGTILNDDAIVTFADVVVTEGDSGTATATFNVVLSNATSESISLGYQTAAGTATPGLAAVGGDYIETNGTLTFAPGETSKSFTVAINGDTTVEDFETFVANLTLTSGSVQLPDPQATGTIQNDDIALANISSPSVTELTGSNNTVSFTVGLTTPNAFDVTVDVQTVDGTATGGSDYIALPPTTVTIPAGMTSVTQDVTIIGDTDFEGGATGTPETFNLEYVGGTVTRNGATTAGTLGTAGTASITDDELPPTVWVIRVNAGMPTMGEVLRDGTDNGMFDPLPFSTFNLTGGSTTVNGDPGTQNDRFIVDFVNGNPIPDGGLTIDGGDETSGDSLEIVDNDGLAPFTFDSVVYTSTGVDSGTIVIDDGVMVPTRTITYAELEPVLDTVAAVDRTFTINSVANPGDHVIDVANAGGRTIISDNGTSAFESVEFANPTSTLTLNAGDGNNTITVGALDAGFGASFTIDAEDGDDSLTATATNIALSIVGGDGADTLLGGTLNDTIDGGTGNDSIDGGTGNDSLAGGADNDTVKGGSGTDSIDGGAGNDSIEGGADGDTLIGGTEDDTILGEDGDDSIDGGAGTDSLDGGAGNDTITGGDGGDNIAGGIGQDSLDGGGDADTVDGGADNDTVLGGSGTDIVSGGEGDDSVDGGSDNDTLSGGGGTDTLVGGTGDDQVSEVAVDAESIVLTDTTLTVGGLSDTISGVEEFILTGGDLSSSIDASAYTLGNVTINGEGGDDTLVGSDGDDFINGGSGNDTLTGGLGNDSMLGGAGSDNLDGGSANDTLAGNGGNDTLNGGVGLDSIDGGTGADVIDGGDDNDTVLAGAGADSVNGGLGNDRLLGEGQDDTLIGDDGDDTLIGGTGGDMIRGGAGIDNLNGNSGRDDLDGGADDDTAFGGSGQDTLTGGQGIDNLDGQGSSFDTIRLTGEAIDDVFTLDRNANFNQLRKTSGATYGVNFKRTETIEINTLDGNDTITVIGDLNGSDGNAAFVVDFGNGNNSLDASLNTDAGKTFIVTAGTGNDTLIGSAGEDNLNGASGDDSIEGGGGEDTLTGGAGADVLNGGAGADLINGGTENDTISGGSEIDTLNAGDGDDSVRGGDGNDLINGEDGNDLLYGDAGNDSILGGRGDDSIDGGDNDDTVLGEDGFDVIKGGSGTDSLVGGDDNDIIDGGNGNDLVNGNRGLDTLLGGADNDTLLGGRDADQLVGGTGADDIRGQGSSGDQLVGETNGADTPDPGDTFDSPAEIDNAFVLNTAILDKLNSF